MNILNVISIFFFRKCKTIFGNRFIQPFFEFCICFFVRIYRISVYRSISQRTIPGFISSSKGLIQISSELVEIKGRSIRSETSIYTLYHIISFFCFYRICTRNNLQHQRPPISTTTNHRPLVPFLLLFLDQNSIYHLLTIKFYL